MSTSEVKDLYYDSHSAAELIAHIILPRGKGLPGTPIALGTLAHLSVSTHRDKFPVSACSKVSAKGFTAGHLVVGGSLAFNTIERAAFTDIINSAKSAWGTDSLRADELPPFNISIVFINEFGKASYSFIKGVTLLDSGVSYSLDNIALMENYSYMALDYIPLQEVTDSNLDQLNGTLAFPVDTPDVGDAVVLPSTSRPGAVVVLPPEF